MDKDQPCPTGKYRHDTRKKAAKQKAGLRGRHTGKRHEKIRSRPLRSDEVELDVYLCEHCHSWHVGHRPGSRKSVRTRREWLLALRDDYGPSASRLGGDGLE